MFCPNCGTQNPDTAQACSKCNFHLKSAAAPKFKGTMLMMNQPGASPGAPPPAPPGAGAGVPPGGYPGAMPGAPGAGAPRPAGAVGPAPGAASKLKGTMVGVAPPMGGPGMPMGGAPSPAVPPGGGFGASPPMHATVPSPAVPPMGPPPGPAAPAASGLGGHDAASFSPPIPQGGVNPLGGTVAADAGAFGSGFGPPQGPPPGVASPYGPPPGGPAPGAGFPPPQGGGPMPYGPPPGGAPYGAPPQGYAPNPYGAPPQGYGQQPMGGMGPGPGAMAPMAQPAGMAPYGQPPGGAMQQVGVGTLQSAGVAAGPRRRNALMTFLLPLALMFGGIVLSVILAFISPSLSLIGTLVLLGGAGYSVFLAIQMANELKSVTRNQAFAWWPIFVPIYSMYWLWFLVPQEVSKAKQMVGVQTATRSILLYIFLWHFALASDLNDLATR